MSSDLDNHERSPAGTNEKADRRRLFDDWAGSYDADVAANDAFPFCGYADVLARVVACAGAQAGDRVLDLGTGTGALAARFVAAGCDVVGVDFSIAMLERARARVPGATFVCGSIVDESVDLHKPFDRIVSTYTFHELTPGVRLELIRRLFANNLAADGMLVVGDIAFATTADRDRVRAQVAGHWDDDEFYMVAAEERPALARLGLCCGYEPVSFCAGVFTIARSVASAGAGAAFA